MILPRRIYDLSLPHRAISVYCYLCERADRRGQCFPTVGRIASDIGLCRTTVFKALNDLEARDLITRQRRYDTHGAMRSSLYTVKGEIGGGG